MKKVAIVGVEGSGKTVMLAGLGDLYSRPDDKGYFLAPKDFNTSAYVSELMERLRSGSWPAATADDVFQGLEWTLRRRSDVGGRPTDICEVSCLDFPGEVYRKAFVETTGHRSEEMQRKIESLWNYIERADSLIVLVNLGDVITHGLANRRVHESIWVTSAILEQALKERPGRVLPKTAIVLSQADNYESTIKACGGVKGALEKYLPHVHNSYGWLDVFAAYTVDKTRLNDDGAVVPDPSFTTEGLRPIMDWLLGKKAQQAADGVKRSGSKDDVNRMTPSRRIPASPPEGIGQYFTLRGRKNRAQYWRFIGFVFLGAFASLVLGEGTTGLGLFAMAMAWPCISNVVRRLHDINLSGWLWFLLCIPAVSWILLILIGCIGGTRGDNKYGPEP